MTTWSDWRFPGEEFAPPTFNLGVFQGLADLGLLKNFDYLSSVSGGGYIASWFASWVRREGSLKNVESQLRPSRVKQASAFRLWEGRNPPAPLQQGTVREEEPEPIYHLRSFSNYLAPKPGIGRSIPGCWSPSTCESVAESALSPVRRPGAHPVVAVPHSDLQTGCVGWPVSGGTSTMGLVRLPCRFDDRSGVWRVLLVFLPGTSPYGKLGTHPGGGSRGLFLSVGPWPRGRSSRFRR